MGPKRKNPPAKVNTEQPASKLVVLDRQETTSTLTQTPIETTTARPEEEQDYGPSQSDLVKVGEFLFEEEADKKPAAINKNPIAKATFDDVAVDDHEINAVGRAKSDGMTRLKSIMGQPVKTLQMGWLKTFISTKFYGKMNRASSGNKKDRCDAIVAGRAKYRQDIAAGIDPYAAKLEAIDINPYRLLNVLFGEICKPQLITRGKSLKKSELNDGKCTDEELFKKVLTEYNDTDNQDYDRWLWAIVEIKGKRDGDPPNIFEPIDEEGHNWKLLNAMFKKLMRIYDSRYGDWKLSGTHSSFEDVVEDKQTMATSDEEFLMADINDGDKEPKYFKKFCSNKAVQYLHEFHIANPEIFARAVGDLPTGCKFEAGVDTTSISTSDDSKQHPSKKRKTVGEKEQEYHRMMALAIEKAQQPKNEAAKQKSNAIAMAGCQRRIETFDKRIEKNHKMRKHNIDIIKDGISGGREEILRRKQEHNARREARIAAGQSPEDDFTPEVFADNFDTVELAKATVKSLTQKKQKAEEEYTALEAENQALRNKKNSAMVEVDQNKKN